jgi:shikimate kinase
MIIYLVGISCVGKTTIGKMLSKKIGYSFYDLDEEVEKFYQKPIERIQDESISMNSYREKASVVLDNFFSSSEDSVIAGTPSGLKYAFLKVYKKHKFTKEIVSMLLISVKFKKSNVTNN